MRRVMLWTPGLLASLVVIGLLGLGYVVSNQGDDRFEVYSVGACTDHVCKMAVAGFYFPSNHNKMPSGPGSWTTTWDFGDGSPPEQGFLVRHEYATFGRFEVTADIKIDVGPSRQEHLTLTTTPLTISSSAITDGKIPRKHACDSVPPGTEVSPPITIKGLGNLSASAALVMKDWDTSNNFTHWTLWDIPIKAGEATIAEGDPVGIEGRNDFDKKGYGGPCPLGGKPGTHRYAFTVYALSAKLDLKESASPSEVEGKIRSLTVAKASFLATYAILPV